MTARGMLYGLNEELDAEALRLAGDQNGLVAWLDKLWNEDWQVETDKGWDELHRTLGDGELEHELTDPLSATILGGTLLSAEDWFVVVHKNPRLVSEVAHTLNQFTVSQFRDRYMTRAHLFDIEVDEQVLSGAAYLYSEVRGFYSRAALEGRSVIFAVDQ